MPALRYTSTAGAQPLRPAPSGRTVVVLYNSSCGHCRYELGMLDRNAERIRGANLVIVTTEDSVARGAVRRDWPRLAALPGVAWGTVDRSEFLRGYGTLATPAFFVFEPDGTLRARIVGETRLENLLRQINE